jgi:hypothetical protein
MNLNNCGIRMVANTVHDVLSEDHIARVVGLIRQMMSRSESNAAYPCEAEQMIALREEKRKRLLDLGEQCGKLTLGKLFNFLYGVLSMCNCKTKVYNDVF